MRVGVSRRELLQGAAAATSIAALQRSNVANQIVGHAETPLEEFGYEQVNLRGDMQVAQRENVSAVLMGLDGDSLLKSFREMAGEPGPGVSLGGWYEWKADYNFHHDDAGLAPGATFGQWMSALARLSAGSRFGGVAGRTDMAERAVHLNGLLSTTIATGYFAQTRFPGYSFDKLVRGGIRRMVPFVDIGDRQYSTYVNVT